MEIKKISAAEAYGVLYGHGKNGLYYSQMDDGRYTAIDNSDGEMWVEEFNDLDNCIRWLRRDAINCDNCGEAYNHDCNHSEPVIISGYTVHACPKCTEELKNMILKKEEATIDEWSK